MALDNSVMKQFITELFTLHKSELINLAYRKLGNYEDSKDVVSLVFFTAIERIDELYYHPNKKAWLMNCLNYRIKQSIYNSTYRKTVVDENNEKNRKYEFVEIVDIDELDKMATHDIYYKEDWLEDMGKSLTDNEKQYIRGRFEHLLTPSELSEDLGKNYSAVTSLGNRAMKKLKKYFLERDKND